MQNSTESFIKTAKGNKKSKKLSTLCTSVGVTIKMKIF